ncbi:CDP-alcohol phosphatidyltransferase family protein [Roseomonas populi]|uniref:CDP-alcohol phosphatidyltransferase family protein n=1 Tax=Roseomonas populi TaxID=3121582 RepID=A0ABT1X9P7_9PROT|nr:CDP-alcohol phosphatidyltransferase family protein [Roseomonas pecuniae]MCR0984825.1 CDP-alcohol phosphatidyltransferase family protein [Roseomonas pecuniae]
MSSNTVIHRIVRPAVRVIAPTGITPNAITTMRLFSGIAAAVALGLDAGTWQAIGAGIFLFSMLLDRADGELARSTGQTSPAGHRYDLLSDCLSNVIAFIGIGVGQMEAIGNTGPVLGTVAGIAIGAIFWQLHILRIGTLRGWEPVPGIVIDPDDMLALVPVFIWVGVAVPMLWAAAIITPLAALYLAVAGTRQQRA